MFPQMPYHPVAIIGGGIIGKLMALSLGRIFPSSYAHKLLLVTGEKPPVPTKPKFPSSNRVSFIAPRSVSFFQELGIWRKICAKGAYPVSSMKASED